ncbi:MAG: leucine-rich repeat protein, partial [Clostridia bacterium]|nr:leucine-rich repeat protein [Clostridia bacterium]
MKTVKRLFLIVLCIITAVAALPLTPVDVFANDEDEYLISSDGKWKYAVASETLPINYGRYDDFVYLHRYIGNETDVIVPEEIDGYYVQVIGEYCFYGDTHFYNSSLPLPDSENQAKNDRIKSITIPSPVISIGDYAFAFMDSLEEIVFQNMPSPYAEFITIGNGVFAGSPQLKGLELPETRFDRVLNKALTDSYIKALTVPSIKSYDIKALPETVEYILITGNFTSKEIHPSYNHGAFSSFVKTVEIEGYAKADYEVKTVLSELQGADGQITNYPDFIFHRVPDYKLEKLLENSGYKKRIDYETGYTEFSVNRFPLDVRYYPFNRVSYGSGIISGDYEYALTYLDNAVIIGYHGNGEEVVFPSEIDGYPVTAIGDGQNALSGNTSNGSAVTVTIPDSVEFINKKAFHNWYALENIEFSRNLKVIESQAFRYCRSLTEIVLPDIAYLGTYAFADCGIKKVAVPSTLKEVSAMSFSEIDRSSFLSPSRILETIELSDGVEIIGTGAFEYSPDADITDDPFVELNLPSTLKFIDYAAFNGTNIKGELKIPGGVKKIDDFAFCSNTKLTSVTLPQRLEYIGEKSFCGCVIQNALVLPDSVCKLEDNAFDALTVPEIVLPDSITVIPNGCFNKSNIEKISGGQNIKLIEDYAFSQATIGEITLPEGLKYLRHTAFDSAKIGTLFYGVNGKDFDDYNYYPAAGAFEKSETQNLIISQTAKHIPKQVFYGAVITGRITMLPGVETICPNAFYMSTMSEITIPETVTTIGAYAFAYCTSLEKAVFSAVNCNSARCIFYGCSNLNEVIISDGVKQIPGAMFKDTDIDSIILPESITAIGSEAFNSIKLKSIVVPENVTFIGAGAFADCSELERVDFLVKSCRLGTGEKYVFESCPALSEFNFGNEIKYIPDNLLRGSGALENVTIPASVTDIGSYSFASTKLTQIIIPEGVESIGDGCFENCACLEHITINGNIYLIGDGTFSGCGNLKEIYIADSVRNIGRSSFAGCSALETVYMSSNIV